MHLIQGFLGAGKTTFSKRLVDEKGIRRLNADEWVEENFSAAEQAADWDACFSHAVNQIWSEAAALTAAGEDVILDIGFWSRTSRDDARQRAREMGAAVTLHHVVAPDEVLRERLRLRRGVIAESNLRNFDSLKSHYEPPGADEHAVVVNNG